MELTQGNLMKSSLRLAGVTLLASGLGLGGTVLSAAAASADTGLKATATMSGDHRDFKDDTCMNRHDSSHGWWDSKGRFHDRDDHSGWRDDNCNWRSDDDTDGRWHDGNGCEHDRWGWWSHDGRFNWDDRSSRSHDHGNSGDHHSDHKSDNKDHNVHNKWSKN
jgi:hypothetical protein